jgi:hypothetical protein
VLAANPAAPDGDYTLYLDHDVTKAWEAYCDAMSGTPREYLRLLQPNTFEDRVPWQDPKFINYSRVRIDPITLVVKVTDQTFATRTGNLTGAAPDYATASSCKAYNGNGDVGHGKIDLQGTPFFVQDSFSHYGWCSYHSAVFSSNNQVVDLVGDGQCGAVAPLSYASYYGDGCNGEVADPTQDPDWSLQLAFLP